jgi:uncharacterized membrane protein YkoI
MSDMMMKLIQIWKNSVRSIAAAALLLTFASISMNATAKGRAAMPDTAMQNTQFDPRQDGYKVHANGQSELRTRDIRQFAQQRDNLISPSQAKSAAQANVPDATFVNVQLVNDDTYRVRLEKNGKIIDVYVDARTGRVKN